EACPVSHLGPPGVEVLSAINNVANGCPATSTPAASACSVGCQRGPLCPADRPCLCVGDCGDGGPPFGNDGTKIVNIVAGADLSTCPSGDANCDGEVFGNE